MVNVAILGYGVVGSGVAEVIDMRKDSLIQKTGKKVVVKKILDVREFKGDKFEHLITHNFDDIINDDSIEIVVETIGGATIAYEFTKRALEKGKHVVTSNKELVSTHGPELLNIAKEKNVSYLFEASVGGGIPIIRPMLKCLQANEIQWVTGILNGTTNYILTNMKKYNEKFESALKSAQEKGYAEANPEADIEGYDSRRKIAILSSIAYDMFVDNEKIYTKGITEIEPVDFKYAAMLGREIKLLGQSKRMGEKIFARVSPALVDENNMLANVESVFNAIVVNGDALGDAMFYGRGAGKLPTASAVVADVIDAVKHIDKNLKITWNIPEKDIFVNIADVEEKFYIRINTDCSIRVKQEIEDIFGSVSFIKNDEIGDSVAFLTETMTYGQMEKAVSEIKDKENVDKMIVLPLA